MNPLQRSLSGVIASQEVKEHTKACLSAALQRRAGDGRSSAPRLIAACSCLILVLLGLGGWQVYRTPVSYISIDVNPSIELALNRFNQVVEATAYNEDGADILDSLSFRGQSYQAAVSALFADPLFQSYLDQGAKVVFTIVSNSEAELRRGLQSGNYFLSFDSEYFQADTQCLDEAHENGLSVGKYRMYEELSQYGSSVTVEDCHRMTIGELQQELARCSGHGSSHEDHHTGPNIPSPSQPPSVSPSAYEQSPNGHGHNHGGGHHQALFEDWKYAEFFRWSRQISKALLWPFAISEGAGRKACPCQ